jgi:hypothetical protein
MDRVRFGRALGTGAREAAKALMKAADAAKAPNPNPPAQVRRVEIQQPVPRPVREPAQQPARARLSSADLKRGGRKFGEAMWAPVAKAGSVLWLEVTGVLFGLFAVGSGTWAWGHRADLAGAGIARQREWFAVAMFVVFAYFTVSSYVRAAQRGRRL